MAGVLKVISNRLKSVKNIQKITKSMKMVSVAKYARAERLLKNVRPFGDGNKLFYEKLDILPEKEQVLVFAVSSDRGLCGGCHTNVAKKVFKTLEDAAKTPDAEKNYKVVCLGDRSRSIIASKFPERIVLVIKEIGKKPPTFIDASIIVLALRGIGWLDRYWIIHFNKILNMMLYNTNTMFLTNYKGMLQSPKLSPYDDIEDDLVQYYVQFSKVSLLYYALVESSCSEHSSRMTAMDSATKNATDMITKLRIRFNRGRQANITKELIEIISGASALEPRD